MNEIRTTTVFLKLLWTGKLFNMGSVLPIVVKLYIYKYSDIGNLRKFEYFYDYFCRSLNAWNTIKLANWYSLDQYWKLNILTAIRSFSILYRWYCFGSVKLYWAWGDRLIWFSDRNVFGSQHQGNFRWLLFLNITFHTKPNQQHACYLILQSINARHPNPTMRSHIVTIEDRTKEKGCGSRQNRGGVCCKGKGWRDGGKYKGGNNQED